ncbi:MAG: hypothetical protein GY903_00190 [Fuerstiella sp.]|nr:hypothetical protein [Fuerstiella sp.]MCP4852898.1 hypothetical protein [Fuerstiella sp.]
MDLPLPPAYASSGLMRVAFRAAFLTTFQDLLDEFKSGHAQRNCPGFLSQVPIAAGCALQVQLDVLFRTWQRIASGQEELNSLEQCVCFYALGELARLGEIDDHSTITCAVDGADVIDINDRTWLTSTLRAIQITWPFPVDAADLQRDVSLLMADADAARVSNREQSLADEFLELIGDWTVSPQILRNARALLTSDEFTRLGKFFSEHPHLMNL